MPADPKAQIERINQVSAMARTSWIALLGYLAFVGVTLLGVEDADFFVPTRQTQLPLVNVSIPTASFFIFAPILAAALYVYLHIILLKLWDAIGDLTEATIDRQPIGDVLFPWLVNDWALSIRGGAFFPARPLRALGNLASFLLVWAAAPMILAGFWWRSMPAHHPLLSLLLAGCFLTTLAAGIIGSRTAYAWLSGNRPDSTDSPPLGTLLHDAMRTLEGRRALAHAFRGALPGQAGIWALAAVLAYVTLVRTAWPTTDNPPLARAYVVNIEMVALPDGWRDWETARTAFRETWCKREGLDMSVCDQTRGPGADPLTRQADYDRRKWCSKHGIADGAPCDETFTDLDARFDRDWRAERHSAVAELPRLNLAGRDLRRIDGAGVTLIGADLTGARLEGANLDRAQLEGSELRGAQLERANLAFARLEGSDLRWAQLEGLNLGGAFLQGANLSGANLEGADLRGTRLDGAVLNGARLKGADLLGTHFEGAHLRAARLQGVDLRGMRMEGADLMGVSLEGTDLTGAQLEQANLVEVQLQGAKLGGAQLGEANLRGARLERAYLGSASLERADLTAAHLEGSNLVGANLEGAKLGGARLEDVNLGGAQMNGVNLGWATLDRANFFGAQLERANLGGTVLRDVNLVFARLKEVDFRGARLDSTDLRGGDLRESKMTGASFRASLAQFADLRGVQGLTQGQLDALIGDAGTLLPFTPHGVKPLYIRSCWETPPDGFDALVERIADKEDRKVDSVRDEFLCGPDNPRPKTGTPLPLDAPYPPGHPLADR